MDPGTKHGRLNGRVPSRRCPCRGRLTHTLSVLTDCSVSFPAAWLCLKKISSEGDPQIEAKSCPIIGAGIGVSNLQCSLFEPRPLRVREAAMRDSLISKGFSARTKRPPHWILIEACGFSRRGVRWRRETRLTSFPNMPSSWQERRILIGETALFLLFATRGSCSRRVSHKSPGELRWFL